MEDKFFDSDMFGGDSPDNEDISFSSMLSAINGDEANDDTDRGSDSEAPEPEVGEIENAPTDETAQTAENDSDGYTDEPSGADNGYPDNAAAEQSGELTEDSDAGVYVNNIADEPQNDNYISDDASDAYADDAEPTDRTYESQADGQFPDESAEAAYNSDDNDENSDDNDEAAYSYESDTEAEYIPEDDTAGSELDIPYSESDAPAADDPSDSRVSAELTEDSIVPAEPASPKAVPLSALHRDAELSTGHGRRSKSKRGGRTTEPKKKLTPGCVIRRVLASVLAAVIIAVYLVLTVIFVLVKGPSPSAKRLFVLSVKETSAAGFLANIFLPSDEVDAILAAQEQSASGNGETTDSSLINISKKPETDGSQDTTSGDVPANAEPEDPGDGIEIIEVKKESFNGVIMKVSDPKRVFLGIPDSYGETSVGLTLRQMAAKYGAIGGINAGGFYDPNGSGTGGIPDGLVINDGELIWGNANTAYNVIGFDGDGILHVGNMTGSTALSLGIKYACCFGPTLVVNGKPCNARGSLGGGMNPRTAIGQTADGSVLFVVINGRSLGSLGATYDDLTDLLIEYGAVNGSNLDGGSSSLLLYNGEFLNVSASVIGERELPTSFLVK